MPSMPSSPLKRRFLASVTLWVELETKDREGIPSAEVDKLHAQAGHLILAMGYKQHREAQTVLLRELE
jgi:hypothetical protein